MPRQTFRFQDLAHVNTKQNNLKQAKTVAMMLDEHICVPSEVNLYLRLLAPNEAFDRYGSIEILRKNDELEARITVETEKFIALTTAHEFGHLWEIAVNRYPNRIMVRHAFRQWRNAVGESPEFQELFRLQEMDIKLDEVLYYMSLEECWARSFAQYFAIKQPRSELSTHFAEWVAEIASNPTSKLCAWVDFEPIMHAMDTLFDSLGLRVSRERNFPER